MSINVKHSKHFANQSKKFFFKLSKVLNSPILENKTFEVLSLEVFENELYTNE